MFEIKLEKLRASDREQFILDNQEAFNYGALEEYGRRDDHFEEDEQIISRETIERSIDGGEAYRIVCDGQNVGGVILKVEGERGDLEILFVSPRVHSKGIGYAAWCEVEKLHPEVRPILKRGIYISMSTAEAFISWNSITVIIPTRMIRNCRSILTSSFRRVCSGLRRGWIFSD